MFDGVGQCWWWLENPHTLPFFCHCLLNLVAVSTPTPLDPNRIKARRWMCQRYRSYICVLYCAAIDAVRQAEAGSTSRFRFSLATIRVWTRVIDITACVRGDGHILIVYISSLYLCVTPASKTLPLPPPIITHHHTGRPLLTCPSHRQRHLPIRH